MGEDKDDGPLEAAVANRGQSDQELAGKVGCRVHA
jgi:hypothetical protein